MNRVQFHLNQGRAVMKEFRWVLLGITGVVMGLFNTGCASQIYGTTQTISITSSPPGSTAKLREVGASQASIMSAGALGSIVGQGSVPILPGLHPGPVIKTVMVPGDFTLDKSGSTSNYGYLLTIEKDGYKPAQVHLAYKLISPNCLFVQALAGMLIVPVFMDTEKNACMELAPSKIEVTLEKENGKKE